MKKILLLAFAALAFPAFAADYYFSDCQTGRQDGCVAGDNTRSAATAQNPATPWQTFAAVATHLSGASNVPAGTRFFFARGGSWAAATWGQIHNGNCTVNATTGAPTNVSCLTFDSYSPSWGGTAKPWLRTSSGSDHIIFGSAFAPAERGGIIIRNIKWDGGTVANRFLLNIGASHVRVEDNEFTGYGGDENVPVFQLEQVPSTGSRYIAMRRNTFSNNTVIGLVLGGGDHFLFEGNTSNNDGYHDGVGLAHHHCMYLSSHTVSMTIRNNTFHNCTSGGTGVNEGGNLTIHGVARELLVEGNTFTSDNGWGNSSVAISINPGYADSGSYASGECLTRVIVRGNRISVGNSAIDLASVPNIIIEGNLIQKVGGNGIVWRSRAGSSTNDCNEASPTIRNNTIRIRNPNGSTAVHMTNQTITGVTATNNIIRFEGTASGSNVAWRLGVVGNLTLMSNNSTTNGAGGTFAWSELYSTRAAAVSANAAWDANGDATDPEFSAAFSAQPTSKAAFSCAIGEASPSRSTGNNSAAPLNSIDGRRWGATVWKGACGPNN